MARDVGDVVPCSTQQYFLGEGPRWDESAGVLYWVDIEAGNVYRSVLDGELQISPELVCTTGTVASSVNLTADGQLVVTTENQVVTCSPDGGSATVASITVVPGQRFNDACCDPRGRLFAGTLTRGSSTPTQQLRRLDAGPAWSTVRSGVRLANGIAWSPAGDAMFFVDSDARHVLVGDYDLETGECAAWRVFATIDDGNPDGLAMDCEGHLWVAVWGTGQVRRFTPGGDLAAVVQCPTPNVSAVALAGPDLRTIVVTSARQGLDATAAAADDNAGRIFAGRVEVPGLPVSRWVPVSAPSGA